MLDARNIAKVKWYELRAKKELAFNEIIIQNKNNLQSKLSEIKSKYEADINKRDSMIQAIEEMKAKLAAIKEQVQRIKADKETLEKKTKDIEIHEGLIESLSKTFEELKIKYNKNLLHRQIQENHVNDMKKSISALLGNMREVCVSEDQLNGLKDEFSKLCAIFDFSLGKVEKDLICFTYCGYSIEVGQKEKGYGVLQAKFTDLNNISGQFIEGLLKATSPQERIIDIIRLVLRKVSIFCEFTNNLYNLSGSNQIEMSLQDDSLQIEIVLQNYKECKAIPLYLTINDKLDCVVTKDKDSYLYSLSEDKDFLLNHVE
ncbi:hypothetical protein NBO_612g0003 [Nosema bombycis CQ1]|uniref:Uncharacterized protein n=1 Tax=Nosema bombycis (strain CQ1 / CVCC 102059) TaxID=578461 RepID=R0MGS8_NOSB1|nr:hypothetical protein NBO_612g0003 [Nosema bombycis CQ1]|eukprot:EOB11963.1 hypothetical protein NBO_612g0003 [Nosema bombycis CQ1]